MILKVWKPFLKNRNFFSILIKNKTLNQQVPIERLETK